MQRLFHAVINRSCTDYPPGRVLIDYKPKSNGNVILPGERSPR